MLVPTVLSGAMCSGNLNIFYDHQLLPCANVYRIVESRLQQQYQIRLSNHYLDFTENKRRLHTRIVLHHEETAESF